MKLKKTWMSVLSCVLACAMALSFAACKPESKDPVVTAIALDKTTATIATEESVKLTVNATYDDGSNKALGVSEEGLSWTSSDEKVATVVRGVVSGKAKGDATITAKYGDLTATCAVSVYSLEVQLSETSVSIEKGETKTLTAKALKDGAEQSAEFEWTSSDPSTASVDGGVVTALKEGPATITATIKGGSQSAKCEVTVVWSSKPAGYKAIDNYEQNKVPANTWGYWVSSEFAWLQGVSQMNEAYTYTDPNVDASKNAGAGAAYFDFEVTDHGSENPNEASLVQIIYRSAGAEGHLETGFYYTLEMDIETNVAGPVTINPERDWYGNIMADEDGNAIEPVFQLETGKTNHIQVKFGHRDDGTIYGNGVYTNIPSAIFLLPGKLEGNVHMTLSNITWTKGEATEVKPDREPEEIPTVEGNPATLTFGELDGYTITPADDGSVKIDYANVAGGSYANLVANIADVAAGHNGFSVKVTNHNEVSSTFRIDIAGNAIQVGDNASSRETGIKSWSDLATDVRTDTTWDGTYFTVEAGKTVTVVIQYEPNGQHGAPTELLFYCESAAYQDTNSYSGSVTIGEFIFGELPKDPELPENATLTVTDADIVSENDKAYFVLKGTSTNVDRETLEAFLNWNHFDLQQCGGAWTPYENLDRTVTVNDNGTWEIKFDVTAMPTDGAAYTGHFGAKDPSDPTYGDNPWTDIKLENDHAQDGKSVTVGSKKYSISNKVGGTEQDTNWGCVSLKIENA